MPSLRESTRDSGATAAEDDQGDAATDARPSQFQATLSACAEEDGVSHEPSVTAGAAAAAALGAGAAPAPNPFAAAAAEASASLSKMTNAAAAFAMAAVTGQKQQQQARSADLEAQQHGERASRTSEAEVAAANIQAALRGRRAPPAERSARDGPGDPTTAGD